MTASFTRKGRVIVAAAIIALISIPAGIAGSAAAAPDTSSSPVAKYVALGDSVAAGQGGGGEVPACLQSPAGYPALLDAESGTNLLRNASCTGATIADVASVQLGQINRGTTLVTVTAGANGIDLPGIAAACLSQDPIACGAALAAAQSYLESGQLQAELGPLLVAITERSPRATIVVTGYPIPFATGVSTATDVANQLAAGLNLALSSTVFAAASGGVPVVFADVSADFGNAHGMFTPDPWLGVNPADPLTFLHPNAAGYVAYRNAVLVALAP